MTSAHNLTLPLPMGNYTKSDLCFGKYFKGVSKFGRMVLNATFLLIYQTLDTNQGTLPVRDYCLQTLQWSGGIYNNTFNSSERQLMGNDPTSVEFVCDISLLFKIIVHVLGNLSDPFKKEIRDIKNLRNTVCHEDLQMDENDLKDRLDELKELCKAVLKIVASISKQNLTHIITEVEGGLQDLLVAKLETSDINAYLQELNNFRQEKHSKMISEGRKELLSVYSKVKVLNPCTWLSDNNFIDFTVENVFTTLKLADSGTPLPMHDILNVTSMRQRFVARMVIVQGVMGAGKTSLYRYLLQQWCSRSSTVVGLMAVDLIIAVEMRTLSSGSLVQFLREQLLKTTSQLFSESDIIPVLQDMNVLFLIDGMDEATHHGKTVVREIVNKFSDSSIMITTRPEYTLELMLIAEDHVVIQMEGFDSESQKSFIDKIFKLKFSDENRRKYETAEFLKYMSAATNSLSTHLALPLTLALLLVLWCDGSQEVTMVTTATRLYDKIYEMCCYKLMTRLENSGAGHGASLKLKVLRWMTELGRVAWDMMCEDVLNLNQQRSDHLINLCDKEGLDSMQTMSTFLKCDTEQNLTGPKYNFSFHHSSGQEFLAAFYVSKQVSTSASLHSIMNNASCSKFKEFVIYVTGLLKINDLITPSVASEIKEVMIQCQGNDPEMWGRLLKEAECDPEVCRAVGSVINQKDLWVINCWDSSEVTEAKINLLRKTGAAPSQVLIQVTYSSRLEDLPQMQDAIKLIVAEGKCKVKLSLDHDYYKSSVQESTDCHIAELLGANRMLEFKGHAGYYFALQLVKATSIHTLYIRVTGVKTLNQLYISLRKHRQWKTRLKPSSKWSLKYLEIFLDLDSNVNPEDLPYLHFHKHLVVKLAHLNDKRAVWAGKVLRRISHQYASVILQRSNLSLKGLGNLVNAAGRVNLGEIRVISSQPASSNEVQSFSIKYRVQVGWGSM